jgi:ribose-phosphate pyrophosphokinase
MTHLNLVDLEKSGIKYKINQFPDGQQSVQILGDQVDTDVVIHSRFNSFRDLELIICTTQALRGEGYHNIGLHVPYFLGGRSDRKFGAGSVNYLKQVVCPIINAQNYQAVIVLDPHSDVLEACINNFEKVSNEVVVKYALEDLGSTDDIVLVSPDAGAYKKIFDIAQTFEIDKIITATKVRDIKTGQILHTEIPTLDQHNKLRYVIVDDICDGGRTFIELAKAIKGSRPTAEIYLIVTHGIFSAGYDQLSEYITKIYTTNSIKDITEPNVLQFNVF